MRPPSPAPLNGGGATNGELHIASLVVHSTPKRVDRVAEAITRIPGAQVHGTAPSGKAVVTLEADSAAQMMQRVGEIQTMDGVLSATLVFQCADSVDAMNQEMPDAYR